MHKTDQKIAIIIGAGPAGLTAAYELIQRTDIKPVIFEKSDYIGGISRTGYYKGNRIDIGGHRFFSKSERVMRFWQNLLPIQTIPKLHNHHHDFIYRTLTKTTGPDPEKTDKVMLIRKRFSTIYFLEKFFEYPLSLTFKTLAKLGLIRTFKIGWSYLKTRLLKKYNNQKSLEELFIHRFGKELYLTFFKSYTEKVWGVPCQTIQPEWGVQRIKSLSILKAVTNAISTPFFKTIRNQRKNFETSLIKYFLYPKYGPGQMWEEVARFVRDQGGEILLGHEVISMKSNHHKIVGVKVNNHMTGQDIDRSGDFFFSTMPMKDLIEKWNGHVPKEVKRVASGLKYRNFIIVGLLLTKIAKRDKIKYNQSEGTLRDQWIYIQAENIQLGRLQIFNNWSPFLLKDKNKMWLGAEYFCNQDDELWSKSDKELIQLAINELETIGIILKEDVIDSTVIKIEKAYPSYFGSYNHIDKLIDYCNQFDNLFLIGRNGMHRYNNQDHSCLTAMVAVDNIINHIKTKDNIWSINTELIHHEEPE